LRLCVPNDTFFHNFGPAGLKGKKILGKGYLFFSAVPVLCNKIAGIPCKYDIITPPPLHLIQENIFGNYSPLIFHGLYRALISGFGSKKQKNFKKKMPDAFFDWPNMAC
jgi:hypothetical protein